MPKPLVDVRFKALKKWNGAVVISRIKGKSPGAVKKAVEHLKKKIQRKLLATRGSEPTSKVGFVRSVQTSAPGQVPFWQTRNLAESVSAQVEIQKTQVKGSVGTRVNYAKTLEEGGFTHWSGQQHLRFTDLKLVNPIKKSGIPIAPRPVWRPTFEEEANTMLEIVKNELRELF